MEIQLATSLILSKTVGHILINYSSKEFLTLPCLHFSVKRNEVKIVCLECVVCYHDENKSELKRDINWKVTDNARTKTGLTGWNPGKCSAQKIHVNCLQSHRWKKVLLDYLIDHPRYCLINSTFWVHNFCYNQTIDI